MDLAFLGDIHGRYRNLLAACDKFKEAARIYQLGDFGFGFPPIRDDLDLGVGSYRYQPTKAVLLPSNLRILRGNHDCPSAVVGHPSYLGDYGVDEFGVGYISGALSIDKHRRVTGYDWWPEEELSMSDLERAIDIIAEQKPSVVISHTAPYAFEYYLEKWPKESRTNIALDLLLEKHTPSLWVCGHHHVNETMRIGGTLFRCVNQNDSFSISFPLDDSL